MLRIFFVFLLILHGENTVPANNTVWFPNGVLYVFCPHTVVDKELVVVGAVRQHGNFNFPHSIVYGRQFQFIMRPVVKRSRKADVVSAAAVNMKLNRLLAFVYVR